ncbi:MAG: HD domain-containing protein [Stackebrandtia sp.]
MNDLTTWARSLARRYLDIPQFQDTRWPHTQNVAARAEKLAPICGPDAVLLTAAAWLHDIGYAPPLAHLDFHPLDGATFLESLDANPRLVALIAHHSAAHHDATLRGLDNAYQRWPNEDTPVRDALWCADMTTSPTGRPIAFDERLADINRRYGPEHPVSQTVNAAADRIRSMIDNTAQRAAHHGIHTDFGSTVTDGCRSSW